MSKTQLPMHLVESRAAGATTMWLRFESDTDLPAVEAGQFLQLRYPTEGVLLNRPYSILDAGKRHLELLIRDAGKQSHHLMSAHAGAEVTVILPLGYGFSVKAHRPLLVGGGVGLAPMVSLAAAYERKGVRARIIYGERSTPNPFLMELAARHAEVAFCTDDGSYGHHGLVTTHPWLAGGYDADIVQVCGPTPMMRAVAAIAEGRGIPCEVSLENRMACGLGACLCCVQDTESGNVCVCTHGPVFNSKEIKW